MYKISTESIGDVKKYLWHYRKDDKEYGPFTYEDIIEKVGKGEIGPEDYVLKFGYRKFIKASEVQGLFDSVVQPEEKLEEKKEEQLKATEEQSAVSKADTKEELHTEFEIKSSHTRAKPKQETPASKIAMIIAAAAGLGMAVWIFTRLL